MRESGGRTALPRGLSWRSALLGVALLLLVIVGVSAYRDLARYRESERWVRHTYEVLTVAERLLVSVTNAETAQRGYLLTGEETYREGYRTARQVAEEAAAEITRLTRDNARQRERLAGLQPVLRRRLDVMAEVMQARERGDASAAGRALQSGGGAALMQRIQAGMQAVRAEEERLLAERSAETDRQATRAALVILGGTGALFGLLAFATFLIERDARRRRSAELALRESEERLRLAVQAAELGLWEVDSRTGREQVSERMQEMLGHQGNGNGTVEQWQRSIHPDDRGRTTEEFARALRGEAPFRAEHRILLPDGDVRWIAPSGTVLRNGSGEPARLVGVAQDITERKQAEQAVRELNESLERRVEERTRQLEVANRELEAFSYSVSHDLRAPLRAVDGYSRVLVEDYTGKLLDDEGERLLGKVRAGTVRMGQLIEDLLNLSRVSRSDMRLEPVDLSALADAVCEELRRGEPERRVAVSVQPGLEARGDARLLRIVLDNLLGNAWKFTSRRDDARIEFGRAAHDAKPAFAVRDNGAGFNMAYAEQLFTPFQRLHKATEFSGTGIGLATVARIIHRHGGTVWAEAEKGKGATFTFTLD